MFSKIVSVALSVTLSYAAETKIFIDSQTQDFKDKNGTVHVFHGHNVVVKRSPYIPIADKFDA